MGGFDRITSRKNERIRAFKALKERKGREEAGLFLAEGLKCVKEALSSDFVAEDILITDEAILGGIDYDNARITLVTEEVMEAVSDTKTPQGIVASIRIKSFEPVMTGLAAVLDDVSDPANVGSIIRSADAAGASCVIVSEGCADPWGPKAVRATMGSIFHVPVIKTDIRGFISSFKENGTVVCGHLKGEDEFPSDKNTCIVIGNESRGVSDDIAEMCSARYRIPIYGRAESLNAGVAAGIMLYKAAENQGAINK